MNYQLFEKPKTFLECLKSKLCEDFVEIGYGWYGCNNNKYCVRVMKTTKKFDQMIVNLKDIKICENNGDKHIFYILYNIRNDCYIYKFNKDDFNITDNDKSRGYAFINFNMLDKI